MPCYPARLVWAGEETSAKALEFTILTVARTSEVTDARWSEFDKQATWALPPERMQRAGNTGSGYPYVLLCFHE